MKKTCKRNSQTLDADKLPDIVEVPLRLSCIKFALHASWVVKLYDFLTSERDKRSSKMDGRQHQFASVRYNPGNRNNGVNIVNFEKHQQYLSEDRECAECFFAGNCLGAIQKVCHRTTTDF